jgi:ADP-ribose pyrophosphatase YjhB (NUDIX family)
MLQLPAPPVPAPMNFCPACGARVTLKVPAGDVFPRHVCEACGIIHYSNPKMVVGCIPVWESRILLCKRAIEPRRGCWTPPAGFMENGETTAEAALRETLEEARARVEVGDLYSMLSVPHVNQVHIFHLARLLDLDFAPGAESLEVDLFEEADIPWKEIAFRTISTTLRHYFADRKLGRYGCHSGAILPLK